MKKIIAFLLLISVLACSNNENGGDAEETVHSNANDTIVTNATPLVLEGCYEMLIKEDTARMNLSIKDTIVTGLLSYHWREKDWNDGHIKGVLRNDIIHADYTFQSEGITSVREVIFKIQDGMLVQGFGELTDVNGKVNFKNKDALQYDSIHPFVKVDCPK